ncbi:MAG TPA: GTP-dependent dephospho-CoA kinase family protein [Dongiaceae bacterium]|nr:GTP-dependent dephospho-CoA kinase family protein [Dongiaceae bacterium]
MIQLRPSQADLERLKEPFGKLLSGDPSKTMPELNKLVRKNEPSRVTAVGDVVSRETLAAGIPVDLRIIDHISMRKPAGPFAIQARKTYHVRNPAGVISMRAWEIIKRAMREEDVVLFVEGEEDLLALPCIVESPDKGLVLYGQPSQGLVVVETTPAVKKEAGLIVARMIREDVDDV